MSTVDLDPHTLCHRCLGQKCSVDKTCSQCNTWDPEQWEKYQTRPTYAARHPKASPLPVVPKMYPLPPELTIEVPFDMFVTPERLSLAIPPVPPTPMTRMQQDTDKRFQSLETSFTEKMEAMMSLMRSMAEGPKAIQAEPPVIPRPPVIHVVDGHDVRVVVEEKKDPSIPVDPAEDVGTLVVWEPSKPQTTSNAIAALRRASASADVLSGRPQKDNRRDVDTDGRQKTKSTSTSARRSTGSTRSTDSTSTSTKVGSGDAQTDDGRIDTTDGREMTSSTRRSTGSTTSTSASARRSTSTSTSTSGSSGAAQTDAGRISPILEIAYRDRPIDKPKTSSSSTRRSTSTSTSTRRSTGSTGSTTISSKVGSGVAQTDDGRDCTLDVRVKDNSTASLTKKPTVSKGSTTARIPANVPDGTAQQDNGRDPVHLDKPKSTSSSGRSSSSKSDLKPKEVLTDFDLMVAQMESMRKKLDDYQTRFESGKSSQDVETSQPTASSSTKDTRSHHGHDTDHTVRREPSSVVVLSGSAQKDNRSGPSDVSTPRHGRTSLVDSMPGRTPSRSHREDESRHSRDSSHESREDHKRRRLSDSVSERDRSEISYRTEHSHRSTADDSRMLPAVPLSEEEKAMEANYSEVMDWIQDYSPQFNMAEETRPVRPKSFTESLVDSEQPSTSKALPWSPGCNDIMDEIGSIVRGDPSSRKSTAPIKRPKLIPSYEFPSRFYRILGNPKVEPPTVNPQMEDLVSASKRQDVRKPKVRMSTEDCLAVETSSQRSRILTSSLDWQLGTAVKILMNIMATHETVIPELAKIHRLLQSAGKTTTQIQKEVSVLQANQILRRRDAVLDLLPRQVTDIDIQRLRTAPFTTPTLFDPATIASVASATHDHCQREMTMRAVQHPTPQASRHPPSKVTFKPVKGARSPRRPKKRSPAKRQRSRSPQKTKSFSRTSPIRPAAGRGRGRGRGRGNQGRP